MPARIVSVIGATGTQASAVVHALLKDGTFSPRAITRNPDSDAAKKLKELGVEVVQGDGLDKASLVSALRGSEAVFAYTVPMFPLKGEGEGPNEIVQGKNMVDAAKEVGVKFFIWTGMPSIAKISGGKYTACLHYDQKAVVEAYLKASGIPNATLYLGAFLENYWKFGLLKKNPTGPGFDMTITNYKPTDKEAFSWIEREVPAATLLFLKGYTDPAKLEMFNGKAFPVVNECMTYAELAERTGRALGVPVTFTSGPPTGMPAIDDMFLAHAEYSGLFTDTPVPNPGLVALGLKFGTIEEFLENEVKPRFGQK